MIKEKSFMVFNLGMRNKIKEIKKKCEAIFIDPKFPFGSIQEIISEIQGLPIQEQSQFIDIYKEIGQKLFERNINVSNYDFDAFLQEIEDWKKGKKEVPKKKDVDDFERKLSKFIECIKNRINNLRRYIIIRVGKNGEFTTRIFLLHDQHSSSPFLNSIRNDLHPHCEINKIQDFLGKIKTDNNFRKSNFILLIAFSPGFESGEDGIKFIDEINGYFSDEIEQVNITNLETKSYEIDQDLKHIKEEIKYSVETDLSNKNLNPDVEKIIKKLFKYEQYHNIEYHEILAGFSGSQVFEVQPFRSGSEATKYVIKVNKLDSEKLENEVKSFHLYVKGEDNRYNIETETTEKLRAIKYNYASDDGYTESFPFSDFLQKSNPECLSLIESLFNIRLFEKWNIGKETGDIQISQYYRRYINVDKIISEIALIENKKLEDVEKSTLIINFNKIFSAKVPVYLKTCHGDLHTLNFFIDKKNQIFLIDFGDTDKHHAVLDHATLETSIKFQHIPRYIPIEELLKIEQSLFSIGTFSSKFNLDFILRGDLKLFFQLITKIRETAIPCIRNTESMIDYYISLFLITFRQIKYKGLNQLYALRTAQLLSEMIITNLKL